MVLRVRYLVQVVVLAILAWILWVSYGYFFDKNMPQINLVGLDELGYYCNDMHCMLVGQDSYKVANVSVWLDEKPLVKSFRINRQVFEYEVPIDTAVIENGKHTLKIEAEDGTFHKNKASIIRDFYVDNTVLQKLLVKLYYQHKNHV